MRVAQRMHERIARQPLLLHQEFQRATTAPASGDFEHAGLAALIVEDRPHGDAVRHVAISSSRIRRPPRG